MDSTSPSSIGTDVPMTQAGSNTKLFLGGLSYETTEDGLRSYFEKYGELEDVVVMRDRLTRKPRGFGFVTFKSPDSAAAACLEQHTISGRQIEAKFSVPHSEGQPRSKKIFVGGLAPDTDDDVLKQYFVQYGNVVEAQVMVDHANNRSRGFGFVTFDDESAVARVFGAGSMHDIGGKQVEVKSATPKGSGPQGGRGGSMGGMGGRGGVAGRGPFPGRFGGGGFAYGGYDGAYYGGGAGYPSTFAGYPAGPPGYGSPAAMMPYGYGYGYSQFPAGFGPAAAYGSQGYAQGYSGSQGNTSRGANFEQ